MHWHAQMARQNLLFNILFQCFRVANNAQQPGDRHVAVNQRLGLITVADAYPARGFDGAVAAVQAVIQNPRQIVAVDDALNQGFVWIQAGVKHPQNLLEMT